MLSTSLVKPLLPSTLRPPLARALLTSFQLQANSGSYRINSLVYIYPDTFQLCHKLNTFCSPECNTINGNLSGIKQGNWNIRLVFGPLKRGCWRLPKGSKPGNRAAREAPEKERKGAAQWGRSQTPPHPGPGGASSCASVVRFVQVCWQIW